MGICLSFSVPGIARGKQRPRVTKAGHTYTPAETVNAEAHIKLLAGIGMKECDGHLFEGPVELAVSVTCPIPKSWSKRMREDALNGVWRPTSKPDLDNIVKLVADALNGVVYEDDKAIVRMVAEKYYGPEPSMQISVRSMA
jgi:Holliday junction resolvase RusA-like endonuclease